MATTPLLTRRDIRRLMLFMFFVSILILTGLYLTLIHFFANKAAAYAVITSELITIGFIPAWSSKLAKLRKLERTQRLAAYKSSPESHILHLND